STKSPTFSRTAPVKAPCTWPNNSLSSSCSGRAAQLTWMSGFVARALDAWIARARSPLPLPVSPSIRIVASLGPTRSKQGENLEKLGAPRDDAVVVGRSLEAPAERRVLAR